MLAVFEAAWRSPSRFASSCRCLRASAAAPGVRRDGQKPAGRSGRSREHRGRPSRRIHPLTATRRSRPAPSGCATGRRRHRDQRRRPARSSGRLLYWAVVTDGAPTSRRRTSSLKSAAATAVHQHRRALDRHGPVALLARRQDNGLPRQHSELTSPTATASTSSPAQAGRQRQPRADRAPGSSPTPPLFEGASIVLIGTGTSTVAVYDIGLGGRMFFDRLTYQLNTP